MWILTLYETVGSPLCEGSVDDIYIYLPLWQKVDAFGKSGLKGIARDFLIFYKASSVIWGLFQTSV